MGSHQRGAALAGRRFHLFAYQRAHFAGRPWSQLPQEGVLDFIYPLLELIVERQDLDAERLEQLAVWIAQNAPEREPVKIAIAAG